MTTDNIFVEQKPATHPTKKEIRLIFKENKDSGFVSDFLANECQNWNYRTPVFIDAGTGKGKNTFIFKHLLRKAASNNKNVLLFVNRVALNAQQRKQFKTEIDQYRPDLSLKNFDSNNDPFVYGNIIIMSYQSALNHVHINNITLNFAKKLNNVDYVVFDECDFFVSDAFFNAKTGLILENLLPIFQYSTRIYMSATMDQVFEFLYDKEIEIRNMRHPYEMMRGCKPYYYYFPKNYENYNFCFFDNWDEIIDLIYKTPNQKYLCFVKKSQDGINFAEKLNSSWEGTDNRAVFINSENKSLDSSETFNSIIEKESFDENVVFATKVLDRGINIRTEGSRKITNVVLDSFFDESDITQMIGRLRNSDNAINVYIKTTTANEINKTIYHLYEKLNLMKCFYNLTSLEDQFNYLKKYNLSWFSLPYYPICFNNLLEPIIRKKLDLLYKYKDAVENKNDSIEFPFSAKRYSKYYSTLPPASQEDKLKYEYYNNILPSQYSEDLSHLNSYDELVALWFDKKAPVKYKEQNKETKEKWIKFLDSIAIERHTDTTSNTAAYYTPFYKENKCAIAHETNHQAFINRLNSFGIIMTKPCNNCGAVFKYIKDKIAHYNLPFEVAIVRTFILNEKGNYTSKSQKYLKFVTQKKTTTTKKE